MRVAIYLVSISMAVGCVGSSLEKAGLSANDQEPSEFVIERSAPDETRLFDPDVDDELADFILAREAELSNVQERGASVRDSRARVLAPPAQRRATSSRRFEVQTDNAGLQAAVAHVEAVRRGTIEPNPKLVVAAISAAAESAPGRDVMRLVFMTFRGSIQQANADKAYFLSKLQRYNEIAAALADYLQQLNDAIDSGGGCSDDDFDAREVDTSILDADHRMEATRILEERAWVEDSAGLERTRRDVLRIEREVRRRRQSALSNFEHFDQKSSQLFNMLSNVLKSKRDMEMGIIRNLR